jgi:hypothetical protein
MRLWTTIEQQDVYLIWFQGRFLLCPFDDVKHHYDALDASCCETQWNYSPSTRTFSSKKRPQYFICNENGDTLQLSMSNEVKPEYKQWWFEAGNIYNVIHKTTWHVASTLYQTLVISPYQADETSTVWYYNNSAFQLFPCLLTNLEQTCNMSGTLLDLHTRTYYAVHYHPLENMFQRLDTLEWLAYNQLHHEWQLMKTTPLTKSADLNDVVINSYFFPSSLRSCSSLRKLTRLQNTLYSRQTHTPLIVCFYSSNFFFRLFSFWFDR